MCVCVCVCVCVLVCVCVCVCVCVLVCVCMCACVSVCVCSHEQGRTKLESRQLHNKSDDESEELSREQEVLSSLQNRPGTVSVVTHCRNHISKHATTVLSSQSQQARHGSLTSGFYQCQVVV